MLERTPTQKETNHNALPPIPTFTSEVVPSIHFLKRGVMQQHQICPLLPKPLPGPRPFPIIGNILELGTNPHQAVTKLSRIYGPVMSLKLGSITTVVISSPQSSGSGVDYAQGILESQYVYLKATPPSGNHYQNLKGDPPH
ncbi:Ferruginol synthase, partial [Mucuna pruriens]